VAAAPFLIAAFLSSAGIRMLLLAGGGVTTMQASASLTTGKLAFVVAVVAATLVAAARARKAGTDIKRAVLWSCLLLASVAASTAVALEGGVPLGAAVRDAAAVLLLGAVPIVVTEYEPVVDPRLHRFLQVLLVSAGLVASLLFFARFAAARGLGVASPSVAGLGSIMLPFCALAWTWSRSLVGGRTTRWRVASVALAGPLLLSGTRSALVVVLLCVAPLLIHVPVRRLFAAMFVVAVVGAAFAGAAFAITGLSRDRVATRLASITNLGQLTRSDESARERIGATRIAWRAARAHLALGSGPGSNFSTFGTSLAGISAGTESLDTPVEVIAKYGLVGAAVQTAFVASLIRRAWRNADGSQQRRLAVLSLAVLIAGYASLKSPIDDKGIVLGLVLLLPLCSGTRGRLQR
jgi:hypothetical protein